MNLSMGNKNVVVGLVVLMLYLSMSFFIERTSAMHQFHEKAAAVVVDTKGSSSLLDHQVVDVKRGPAYRKGGIFFTNYYPASYVRVPNSVREAGYNMRWYAWWFALFNIVVGIIVGIQKQANPRLRTWASRLAIAVVGIDDLRSGRPDLEAALNGLDAAIPTILLSHRPEVFPRAAAHGIALTLSGHYHGGQVKLSLPGGDFSLATLRTPYPEGLYRSNGSHLYVSRGIGTTFTPVRLNAPPEVTVLHLT